MTREKHHHREHPALPILDEVGDALNREFRHRQRTDRRRRFAAGALTVAVAAVAASTVAMVGERTPPARAVEIAVGHTARTEWRLVLVDADSGPCLQLRPGGTSNGGGPCVPLRDGRFGRGMTARARVNGQPFVYGLTGAMTQAIRVNANGHVRDLAEHLLPSTRDPHRHGDDLGRSVQTKPLPRSVQTMHLVPPRTRVFVAAVPDGRTLP